MNKLSLIFDEETAKKLGICGNDPRFTISQASLEQPFLFIQTAS